MIGDNKLVQRNQNKNLKIHFRKRAEGRLQQRTNPTSKFQMTINATDLFERYLYDEGLNDYIDSSIPTLEGNSSIKACNPVHTFVSEFI